MIFHIQLKCFFIHGIHCFPHKKRTSVGGNIVKPFDRENGHQFIHILFTNKLEQILWLRFCRKGFSIKKPFFDIFFYTDIPTVEAFVSGYTEIPEGADVAQLTPQGVIAYVEKYAEITTGADVSGLTPEIAACFVAGYQELAEGADVSLLKPSDVVAYVTNYAEEQGVDISGLAPDGVTAFVMAYEEASGGALTTALTPTDIAAIVANTCWQRT